ncbi:DUF4253 domain-containing protein [Aeoliella sp.]|uniref:DUF4253 domain-containing protein n=1 Tax=Aeoliella sp. TaxID=2795800 RepID=UPI003CCB8CAD
MNPPDKLLSLAQSLLMKSDLCQINGFGDSPCWSIRVAGSGALAVWTEFRDQAPETNFWPVIVGDMYGPEHGGSDAAVELMAQSATALREMSDKVLDVTRLKKTTAETLEEARRLPFLQWAERQRSKQFLVEEHLRKAAYFDSLEGASSMAEFHRSAASALTDFPDKQFDPAEYDLPPKLNHNPPQHELHCLKYFDIKAGEMRVSDSVTLLFVPTEHSWEVPAYLFYSTLEDERQPQVHVAALKYLFDSFGAELVSLDSRMMEVIPKSRPTDATVALQVAVQLNAYSSCPVTSQNVLPKVDELAYYLMESEYWSFCWL